MADVNLDNYEGMFNEAVVNDTAGAHIDAAYWNELWETARMQGNYNAQTLVEIVAKLSQGVWHIVNGAASIKNPPVSDGTVSSLDNVSNQLSFLAERVTDLMPLLQSDGAAHLETSTFDGQGTTTVAEQLNTLHTKQVQLDASSTKIHNNMGQRNAKDCHPISAITNLASTLNALAKGHVSAYPHNLLPGRGAIGAHPIGAIEGLSEALSSLAAQTRTGTQVLAKDPDGTTRTLQALLDNIYLLLAAATGVAELQHNALSDRNVAGAHTIAAVTGLQAALDNVYTKQEINEMFQKKIVTYTGATPPEGLPNGTICLRIG